MENSIIEVTARSGKTPYRTAMQARTHVVFTDEPVEDGGQDTAPKPTELLCMSLASCTIITLQMYAARKQWDTGEITVQVKKITEGGENKFETEITFEKELAPDVIDRLHTIAKKCPVHKILSRPVTLDTKILVS